MNEIQGNEFSSIKSVFDSVIKYTFSSTKKMRFSPIRSMLWSLKKDILKDLGQSSCNTTVFIYITFIHTSRQENCVKNKNVLNRI